MINQERYQKVLKEYMQDPVFTVERLRSIIASKDTMLGRANDDVRVNIETDIMAATKALELKEKGQQNENGL